jgi:mannonate dehydratase
MKLSVQIKPDPSDAELSFVGQLGAECVYTWVDASQANQSYLTSLRRRVEGHGLHLYNVGFMEVAKSDKIHLALPGRDDVIHRFQQFLRDLAAAGISTTPFTWEPTQVWSSEPGVTRGAKTRSVDLEEMTRRPFTHGRAYSSDEVWANFEYFIRKMIPSAEETGVRLALHPNDPPAPMLGGIPCLIHTFDDYKRAFEIAGSDALGMEFCTGCWLEGGDQFGDLLEAIRYFGQRGKIFIVHFRNVSSPFPKFVETFLDNGYMDMYRVMHRLRQVDYRGTITLDHTPKFDPPMGLGAETAYAIGYMRALVQRADAEVVGTWPIDGDHHANKKA